MYCVNDGVCTKALCRVAQKTDNVAYSVISSNYLYRAEHVATEQS